MNRSHPWFTSHENHILNCLALLAEENERTDALIRAVDIELLEQTECYTRNVSPFSSEFP